MDIMSTAEVVRVARVVENIGARVVRALQEESQQRKGKLVMGIDWVDNPRPMSARAQAREILSQRFAERKRRRETELQAGRVDAAKMLAAHPSYVADPFAYGRAMAHMVAGLISPQEIMDAKGAVSV